MGRWRKKRGWNISGWGWGKRTSYVVVLTLHRQHRFVRLLPGRFLQRFHPRGIRSVIGGIERRLGGDVRNGSRLFAVVPIVEIIIPRRLLI